MANNRAGFLYFSLETDRYQSREIRKLKKRFGGQAIVVYDYIQCEIFRIEGCYILWDDCFAFDIAEYFCIDQSDVEDIVKCCVEVGLFDNDLYAQGVLSSLKIQERYIEMSDKLRRKNITIPDVCQLATQIQNVVENGQNAVKNAQNAVKNGQNAVENAMVMYSNSNNIPPISPFTADVASWRDDFEVYLADLDAAYNELKKDTAWIAERQTYHPTLDIDLSLQKANKDYWATKSGWQKKRKTKSVQINWKQTFNNALSLQCNQVRKQYQYSTYNNQTKNITEKAY